MSHPPARPKLAYVYHPRSFPALSVAEAARDVCDLLWVVDSTMPDLGSTPRLLARLGEVVDVAGMSVPAAASVIGKYQPTGVLSLADSMLAWTAEVASLLGKPFHSPAVAAMLTDKHAQRAALAAGGLAVPGFWVIADPADEADLARIEAEARFPAVLKPRQGEGSRNTRPVASFAELRATLAELRTADGPGGQFVLEEYIPDAEPGVAGDGFAGYVSVESVVCDGVLSHLTVTGRTPPAYPFRETGFFVPSALGPVSHAEVLDVAARAAKALQIHIGCLHTEIKLTPDGPVVIEVNGRIGGGVSEMLELATGVCLLQVGLRLAIGESATFESMPPAHRVGYLLYVQAPEELRQITAVDGLPELRAMAGVDQIVLNRGPGRQVDWRDGNHGHVFSVAGAVADHDEFRTVNDSVATLVTIHGT